MLEDDRTFDFRYNQGVVLDRHTHYLYYSPFRDEWVHLGEGAIVRPYRGCCVLLADEALGCTIGGPPTLTGFRDLVGAFGPPTVDDIICWGASHPGGYRYTMEKDGLMELLDVKKDH